VYFSCILFFLSLICLVSFWFSLLIPYLIAWFFDYLILWFSFDNQNCFTLFLIYLFIFQHLIYNVEFCFEMVLLIFFSIDFVEIYRIMIDLFSWNRCFRYRWSNNIRELVFYTHEQSGCELDHRSRFMYPRWSDLWYFKPSKNYTIVFIFDKFKNQIDV